MDTPEDIVTGNEADDAEDSTGSRPMVVHRIKQALVTSRVTLGAQSTGLDPYDRGSTPGSVWSHRTR